MGSRQGEALNARVGIISPFRLAPTNLRRVWNTVKGMALKMWVRISALKGWEQNSNPHAAGERAGSFRRQAIPSYSGGFLFRSGLKANPQDSKDPEGLLLTMDFFQDCLSTPVGKIFGAGDVFSP